MQRQRRTNLLLLLLVLLLGLGVWLSPEPARGPVTTPLTGIDPAAVQRIEISTRQGRRLVLARDDSGWRLLEPVVAAADPARVERLLQMLSTSWIERFNVEPERLAEFDLAPPLAELRFDDTRIRFGGTHPLNRHRYLMLDDGRIHLTRDIFPHLVQANPESFTRRQKGAND
ncbi:MAG: DUF4340 domain-containing protein [Sedimenticola sp.]|nr:DUF4340 domain-containing protein [Sedimenticola sp.]